MWECQRSPVYINRSFRFSFSLVYSSLVINSTRSFVTFNNSLHSLLSQKPTLPRSRKLHPPSPRKHPQASLPPIESPSRRPSFPIATSGFASKDPCSFHSFSSLIPSGRRQQEDQSTNSVSSFEIDEERLRNKLIGLSEAGPDAAAGECVYHRTTSRKAKDISGVCIATLLHETHEWLLPVTNKPTAARQCESLG